MRPRLSALALLATTALVVSAGSAEAYQVQATKSGAQVHWESASIEVTVDPSVSLITSQAEAITKGCFATWEAVDGATPPPVNLHPGQADVIGFHAGTNLNTIRYAPAGSDLAQGKLMITIASYDDSTGVLQDADILINGTPIYVFAVLNPAAPVPTDYDLSDALTHEVGHFLGMAHNPGLAISTMYPFVSRGETSKRALNSDDEQGLAALYPPGGAVGSCATRVVGASRSAFTGLALSALLLAVGLLRRVLGGVEKTSPARGASSAVVFGASASAFPIYLAAALVFPVSGPRPSAQAPAPPLPPIGVGAHIAATEARWEEGIVKTRLDVAMCEAPGDCAEHVSMEVYGGTIDGVTQVVGANAVPAQGALVRMERRGGRLLVPEDFPMRVLGSQRLD